jgi:16S rRNA (uracil1498-N3)-methyltransferase
MPQRYFIDDHAFERKQITGNDAHHIIKVMRMKPNDQMIVCNNNICHIVHITNINQHVEFAIDEKLPTKEVFDVTLIQGLPKGSKIDTVTKYATIFGVSKIIFVEMNRSISKEKNVDNKLKRLETIAKEAAELAHRSNVPSIEFIKSLKEINMKDFNWILVADENEKTTHLTDVISKVHIKEKTALIIGPEGGITDQERNFFKDQKSHFISLGDNILPTEIASLYALSYFSIKNTE